MQTRRVKQYSLYLFLLLFLGLLLVFPTEARKGAESGLLLWFNILLPTLLPFLILSNLLQRLSLVDILCRRIAKRTGKKLFFLYPLILGLLCGLPLGAKLTGDALRQGQLSRTQAQFLLTVCNNPSLLFLIGYVADGELKRPLLAIPLFLCVVLSSLLSAMICAVFTVFRPVDSPPSHYHETQAASSAPLPFLFQLQSSVMDGFTVLTRIGGFVILFSVLARFLLLIDSPLTLPLVAACEITSGVHAVCASSLSVNAKTILSAAAVSFTGLSGIAQTACMLFETGLSLMQYVASRILSAGICAVLLGSLLR